MEMLLGLPRMAKTGRPPKSAGEQGTKLVRVNADVADMLSDLALVHPKSTAQILDPLIRGEVEELHKKYLPKIEEAKAVQAAADAKLKQIQKEVEQIATEQSETTKKPKRGS